MIELVSVKTRISAPAHPCATGIGRVSGLVLRSIALSLFDCLIAVVQSMSFVHLFVQSRSFVCLFKRICSFVHCLFVNLFVRSFVRSSVCSFVRSFIRSID